MSVFSPVRDKARRVQGLTARHKDPCKKLNGCERGSGQSHGRMENSRRLSSERRNDGRTLGEWTKGEAISGERNRSREMRKPTEQRHSTAHGRDASRGVRSVPEVTHAARVFRADNKLFGSPSATERSSVVKKLFAWERCESRITKQISHPPHYVASKKV
jgi:hypothetical protein